MSKVTGEKATVVKDSKANISKVTGEKKTAVNDLKAKIKDRTDRFTASQGKLKTAQKRQRTEYAAKISKVTGEKETAVIDLEEKNNERVASMMEEGEKRLVCLTSDIFKECCARKKTIVSLRSDLKTSERLDR